MEQVYDKLCIPLQNSFCHIVGILQNFSNFNRKPERAEDKEKPFRKEKQVRCWQNVPFLSQNEMGKVLL